MSPQELLSLRAAKPAPTPKEQPELNAATAVADNPPPQEPKPAAAQPAVSLEVVDDDKKLLAPALADAGLELESASELIGKFAPMVHEARKLIATAQKVQVTAEDQSLEMSMARQCRLALRKVRTSADDLRKRLKQDSLRRGKAIDGLFHVLEYMITPIEDSMEAAEKFAETAKAARLVKLKAEREALLTPLGVDVTFLSLDLMTEDIFQRALTDAKAAQEARAAREKAAREEAARLAAEQLERDRLESERRRLFQERAKLIQPLGEFWTLAWEDVGAWTEEAFRVELGKAASAKAEHEKKESAARVLELEALELKHVRTNALATWGVNAESIVLSHGDIAQISEANFQVLLSAARVTWNAKKDQEEMERKEAVLRSEKEARERHQADLAQERQMADERQRSAQADADKAKADKAAADERAAKAERELQERKKADAEAAKKQAAEDAKAARAPDKQKILRVADHLRASAREGRLVPEMRTDAGKAAKSTIEQRMIQFADWATKVANEL